MRAQYFRMMDAVHRGCLIVAGGCLLIITLIIPYGVFTRYVLNSAASWPEPLSTLLMIVMSFVAAVVCYREYLHIGVGVLPAYLKEPYKSWLGWVLESLMMLTSVFMLWWGLRLVATTYNQIIPEFPILSVGVSYLPVPLGGGLTMLFIIERMMKGQFFQEADAETVSTLTTE